MSTLLGEEIAEQIINCKNLLEANEIIKNFFMSGLDNQRYVISYLIGWHYGFKKGHNDGLDDSIKQNHQNVKDDKE